MNTKNLYQINRKDKNRAGGKAASLGDMISADFLVPPGFVILTPSFNRYKRSKQIDSKTSEEILERFDALKLKKAAVRSSALVEDSAQASWAGIFESYLDVKKSKVLAAVEDCWRAVSSEKVKAYAKQQGIKIKNIHMAVVVQEMIDADMAGVCFTVNPISKQKNEMIIEACAGSGDKLVNGEVTPNCYVVDKKTSKVIDVQTKSKINITDEQLRQLSDDCLKIEKHFGYPCDIEWCIKDDKTFILQARPITTL